MKTTSLKILKLPLSVRISYQNAVNVSNKLRGNLNIDNSKSCTITRIDTQENLLIEKPLKQLKDLFKVVTLKPIKTTTYKFNIEE